MATEVFKGDKRALITTATTTQVATGRHRLARIVIGAGTMGQIDVYDHASANSNRIWSKTPATGDIFEIDCPMENGIRVVTAAATEVTVVYS